MSNGFTRTLLVTALPGPTEERLYQGPPSSGFTRAHCHVRTDVTGGEEWRRAGAGRGAVVGSPADSDKGARQEMAGRSERLAGSRGRAVAKKKTAAPDLQ